MIRRTSLKDVADKIGVSVSTVSLVLNGKSEKVRISKTLASRVVQAAKELNYIPNPIAISLRTGRSKIVCLIVEDISNPFFSSLTYWIEEKLRLSGYQLVCSSTSNDPGNTTTLIKKLANGLIDGFLITPVEGLEEDVRMLVKNNIPLVLVDSYYPEIEVPHVLVDNESGMQLGMNQLLRSGCKNILYVSVNIDMVQIQQRDAMYTSLMKKNKLKPAVLKLDYKEDRQKAVFKIVKALARYRPDAVFFATNYLGLLGVESLNAAGKKIGEDVKVVCFDDHELFKLTKPAITVIEQPIAAIAEKAIDVLLRIMERRRPVIAKHSLIKPALQKRGSA